MNRRLLVLAGLALAGCATTPTPPTPSPSAPPAPPSTPAGPPVTLVDGEPLPELESVLAAEADQAGLRLRVASSGCTGKADWTFYVERRGAGTALAFARKRLDLCRSLKGGAAELVFSWAELGVPPGARVVLLNPIGRP